MFQVENFCSKSVKKICHEICFFLGSTTWARSESFNCPLFSFPCVARTSWRERASLTFRARSGTIIPGWVRPRFISLPSDRHFSISASVGLSLVQSSGQNSPPNMTMAAGWCSAIHSSLLGKKDGKHFASLSFFLVNQTVFHRVIFCYSTEKAYFYSLKCWIYTWVYVLKWQHFIY